jgi:flagellum-specific peptidoglycan hydrolase FlgJ
MQQGLGSKPISVNDFKNFIKKAFGPISPSNASLEQKLETLSETDLKAVLQIAKLVKYAADFQANGKPFTYKSLVDRMYPKVDPYKRSLVALMLQQADPINPPQFEEPKKSRSSLPDKIILDADAITDSIMKEMGYNTPEQENKIDFNDRVTEEKLLNNYKQYAAKINKEGVFENRQDFVDTLKPIAQEVAEELGIDARVVMAQAILETGYGSKVKGNNYFGIKSHGKANGQTFATTEEISGLMKETKGKFRKYGSLKESVRDYGLFLKENKRYKPLLEADTLNEQIDALARSGYATDSRYGEKIRGIIKGKTFKKLLA